MMVLGKTGVEKMNRLVTGGAGFIGSHIAEYFLSEGHDVTILDNLATVYGVDKK